MVKVAIREPLTKTELNSKIDPAPNKMQPVADMVASALAAVLKYLVRIELPGQQFITVEDDLVVFRMVASFIPARSIPPIFELQYAFFDIGDELPGDQRTFAV